MYISCTLSRNVKNWGPLDAHSAFLYEDLNQEIKHSVKSSNGVAVQISNYFRLKCAVHKLKILHDKNLTTEQKKCSNSILNKQINPQPQLQIGNLGVLGKFQFSNKLPRSIILTLLRIHVVVQDNDIFFNTSVVYSITEIFHSTANQRTSKRINFNIILHSEKICNNQKRKLFNLLLNKEKIINYY